MELQRGKEREIKREEEKREREKEEGREEEKKEIKRLKGRVSFPFRDHISKRDVEPDNNPKYFYFFS